MKVVIAGSGIAGSVLTRMLRERGHEVVVLDPDPETAASRCAFAYLRTAWFTGEARRRVREALRWYDDHGWALEHQATVHDLKRGRVVTQPDHYLIDPVGPLVEPDRAERVEGYREGTYGVRVLTPTNVIDAHHLVLACGQGMDRFTSGTPTYGAVFDAPGRQAADGLSILRITDRLSHAVAAGGHRTRTAASKGRTPESAAERAEAILDQMIRHGVVSGDAEWTLRTGVRWENFNGTPGHSYLGYRAWAFTGFARTGYALVPGAARELIQELER